MCSEVRNRSLLTGTSPSLSVRRFQCFRLSGSSVSSTLWELTVNLYGELGVFFSHKLLPTAVSKDKVLSDDQYKAWLAAAAAGLWLLHAVALNHCGLELLLWKGAMSMRRCLSLSECVVGLLPLHSYFPCCCQRMWLPVWRLQWRLPPQNHTQARLSQI